jgi:hypothetical protein
VGGGGTPETLRICVHLLPRIMTSPKSRCCPFKFSIVASPQRSQITSHTCIRYASLTSVNISFKNATAPFMQSRFVLTSISPKQSVTGRGHRRHGVQRFIDHCLRCKVPPRTTECTMERLNPYTIRRRESSWRAIMAGERQISRALHKLSVCTSRLSGDTLVLDLHHAARLKK